MAEMTGDEVQSALDKGFVMRSPSATLWRANVSHDVAFYEWSANGRDWQQHHPANGFVSGAWSYEGGAERCAIMERVRKEKEERALGGASETGLLVKNLATLLVLELRRRSDEIRASDGISMRGAARCDLLEDLAAVVSGAFLSEKSGEALESSGEE